MAPDFDRHHTSSETTSWLLHALARLLGVPPAPGTLEHREA